MCIRRLSPRACLIRGLFAGLRPIADDELAHEKVQNEIAWELVESGQDIITRFGRTVLSVHTFGPIEVTNSGSHIDTSSISEMTSPNVIRLWRGSLGCRLSVRSSVIKDIDFRRYTYSSDVHPDDGVIFVSVTSDGLPMCRHDFQRRMYQEDTISITNIVFL